MYFFFSTMVMLWIDVLSYDFFLFLYSERCLGQKPLLRKRCYFELIETIRHNNADLKKRYLGQKPLLRKRYYTELIETIRHNNADLKKGWWLNARCCAGGNHPRMCNPKWTIQAGRQVPGCFATFLMTFIALVFSGIWSEDRGTIVPNLNARFQQFP